MSDSFWPYELQHTRPSCPSPSPEFAQAHVHWVGDAIGWSHPLSPTSPVFNLSYHSWTTAIQEMTRDTSLVAQWLRLHALSVGSPNLISGQGTRSHMPREDQRSHVLQLRPRAAKLNKYLKKQVMKEAAKKDESFCQWMLFSLDTWGVRISASTSYLDEAVLKNWKWPEKDEIFHKYWQMAETGRWIENVWRQWLVGLR